MEGTARTPMHLWFVGGVSLLWNAFGCYDYVMTQTRNEAYLAAFTAEQRAYHDTFPVWLDAAWAFGVWGALLGSVLLLMRNRHAGTAFAVSLVGLAVSTVSHLTAPDPPEGLDGGGMLLLHLAVWAGALAFLVYAVMMRRRGVLR